MTLTPMGPSLDFSQPQQPANITYNKGSPESDFFGHHDSSTYIRDSHNSAILGTWAGEFRLANGGGSIALMCDTNGICFGGVYAGVVPESFWLHSAESAVAMRGKWSSSGFDFHFDIPPISDSTTMFNGKIVDHTIRPVDSNAIVGVMNFTMDEFGHLVFSSGPNELSLPDGSVAEIPYGTILKKISSSVSTPKHINNDYYKILNHVEFNNALAACHQSYTNPPDYKLLESIGVDTKKFYDGFSATLMIGTDGKYYLAFEGSPTLGFPTLGSLMLGNRIERLKSTWDAWIGNNKRESVDQLPASHFEQAINLTREVANLISCSSSQNKKSLDYYRFVYSRIILTGHSLGGGLAMAAGIATGLNVITFNSEGVNSYYNGGDGRQWLIPDGPGIGNNPYSLHYSIDNDPLTKALDSANKIDNSPLHFGSIFLKTVFTSSLLDLLRYRPTSILIAQLPKTDFNKHITLKHSLEGVVSGHELKQFDFYTNPPITPESDNVHPRL
jgi:hypothetical protein